MDRIIDLIYIAGIISAFIIGIRIGRGEKIFGADRIAKTVERFKPKSKPDKYKPEVESWTDEEEAELEERENRKNKKALTDKEYFELAKKSK